MQVHFSEASTGFEPVIGVLQTHAFPLGHDAKSNFVDCSLCHSISNSQSKAGEGIRTLDLLLGKETFYH